MKPRPHTLTRRSLLAGAGALAAASAMPTRAAGVPYGVAVALEPFRNAPKMLDLLVAHADLIVPMNALKWASLRHTEGEFDFSGADEIVAFAERHKRAIHGHALLWYAYNPDWLERVTSPSRLEELLEEHIERVVGRYRGRIATWDVANEVIGHDPREGKWRKGIWYDLLGPRHVDLAFARAAKADPTARLALNDYDLEDDQPHTAARQEAILSIIRRLQDRNIPIHQLGMQAHLYAERKIGHDGLRKFLRDLKALGIDVSITELDVIDWRLPAEETERDGLVAATVDEYLGAVFSEVRPRSVTTWGLSDLYSWIDETFPRDDSATARPLPFDANWKRKAMFDVVSKYTG